MNGGLLTPSPWRRIAQYLPMVLLLLALLLMLRQIVENEASEARLQRLEGGLQTQEELVGTLRRLPPLGQARQDEAPGLAVLQQGLTELRKLAELEPAIRPQHRILLAALGLRNGPAGPPDRLPTTRPPARTVEAASLSLQDMGLSLQREITAQRRRLHDRWRYTAMGALTCGMLGVGLLVARLRSARRRDHGHAWRAALASAQVSAFYKAAPVGMVLLDDQFQIIEANPSFAALVKEPAELLAGRPFAEVMPDLSQPLMPLLKLAQSRAEPVPGQDIPVDPRSGGLPLQYAVAAEPVQVPGGPIFLSLVIMDVTDRAAAEAWRGEVMAELNHRVKNTLATVQSLAAQTLRGAAHDPSRFAADFSARLGALSRSHEVIAASGWSGITVEQTVHAALSPWLPSGGLTVVGPAGLPLRAAQAQAIVLGLSELAANAQRHGALGSGGRVTLSWDTLPDGMVRLIWQERGGAAPPVAPPQRGFGLRFLERGLPHDLGPDAFASTRFDGAGFCYEVSFLPHGASRSGDTKSTAAA
ncbi:sensor histidine kinase [Roseomonas marmotae]|uniref:histidine kinase n=1 Tax=Roseomonas marmotae TaxID=2768161 RepID=A0ABS3KKE1_9PROT|nr:HWE histidine kinase domain-containing protein [Roseomonas marmotae]MBO1076806.1 PAS domain-containing protein [Roseomonas marmotae]QTI78729.1 PAS domain-containing protein [Roseomonas marmotae]